MPLPSTITISPDLVPLRLMPVDRIATEPVQQPTSTTQPPLGLHSGADTTGGLDVVPYQGASRRTPL